MSSSFIITAWHWWILALILLMLELIIPTTFFLWLAIASGIVGIVSWFIPHLGVMYHLILFSAFSVVALTIYLRHQSKAQKPLILNRRAEQYVGRILTLEAPIVNGRGKVQLEDTVWILAGPNCPYGTSVKVISTDGAILYVESVKE